MFSDLPDALRKKMLLSATMLVFVITVGTAGYYLIEGWSLFDSFYMVVITMSTVGYQEVHKLSNYGRAFTIYLIFTGVGVVAYTANNAIRSILEGEIQEALGRRKLERKIRELSGHYVICGYGRMGRIICKELKANRIKFVVVEHGTPTVAEGEDILFVNGDATQDEVLKAAGIERAKGVVTALTTDAQNLYVVLSARGMNPGLKIVARAGDEGSEKKLLRAGADRVVSPYHIGGVKIAQTILKPAVVDFLEFATMSGNIELQMEEISVQDRSRYVGQTISESEIGRMFNVIIVSIKRAGGEMIFNPTHKTAINAGDTLIALGEVGKLKELERLARA
jgi:voltage-gated potassium channel